MLSSCVHAPAFHRPLTANTTCWHKVGEWALGPRACRRGPQSLERGDDREYLADRYGEVQGCCIVVVRTTPRHTSHSDVVITNEVLPYFAAGGKSQVTQTFTAPRTLNLAAAGC